ncbi:cAMP-dependent protein kinase inhibitor alpha [Grus japonensis]|uniref:cAMP-dependent protein kinase inhibitor alpha n=1 Tax=Grus japonensis TaxID=30415 RepID=A0ABC9W1L9_GRUJA
MKFNKAKYKVLHLDGENPQYQYRLGDGLIENSPAEKDLGILVKEKLNMSHQCALAAQKANHILGCIKRRMASRPWEMILPLYSGETPPGVLHPSLESSVQEGHGPVRAGPGKGHRNDQRSAISVGESWCCSAWRRGGSGET